nr:hypothetical protein [Tanacetum cinerariifolium]
VGGVAFLPQKLGGAQEEARAHFPAYHVGPLVDEQRQVAVALNPVFVSAPDDGLRGIFVAGALEHIVELALHFLPNGIAIGLYDHAAAHGRILSEAGALHQLVVPGRIIFLAVMKTLFNSALPALALLALGGCATTGAVSSTETDDVYYSSKDRTTYAA